MMVAPDSLRLLNQAEEAIKAGRTARAHLLGQLIIANELAALTNVLLPLAESTWEIVRHNVVHPKPEKRRKPPPKRAPDPEAKLEPTSS